MFTCRHCRKGFATRNTLTRHMRNHQPDKQETCDICGVAFHRTDLLARHQKSHVMSMQHSANRAAQLKRRRCSVACMECRHARTKCDGMLPCRKCTEQDKTCRFEHSGHRQSRSALLASSQIPQDSTPGNSSLPEDDIVRPLPTKENTSTLVAESRAPMLPADAQVPIEVPASSFSTTDLTGTNGVDPANTNLSQNVMLWDLPLAKSCSQQSTAGDSNFNPLPDVGDPFLYSAAGSNMPMNWQWPYEELYLPPAGSPMGWTEEAISATFSSTSWTASGLLREDQNSSRLNAAASSLSTDPCLDAESSVPTSEILDPVVAHTVAPRSDGSKEAEDQRQVVEVLVEYVRKHLDTQHDLLAQHGDFWLSMSPRVRDSFFPGKNSEFGFVDDCSTHLLNRLARLFFKTFNCLWPMLFEEHVDFQTAHPLLYLTIVAMGAMYVREGVTFGSALHKNLRTLLLGSFPMFAGLKKEPLWLLQSIHLHEAGALYFGHSCAFSVSQHLGSILIFASRRLNLFSSNALAPGSHANDEGPEFATANGTDRWIYDESRRRLAFGVFRIDVYRSALLNTRPLMSYAEFSIPAPDRGIGNKVKERSAGAESERTGRRYEFRELVAMALDRQEDLPAMSPVEHEMLIFALHEIVWKYSSHNDDLQRCLPGTLHTWSDDILPESSDNQRSRSYAPTGHHDLDHSFQNREDQLDFTTNGLSDRHIDCLRLLHGLRKWKCALASVQSSTRLENHRSIFLSGLMAYHTAFLRLNAPLEPLHQISYMAQGVSTLEPSVILIARTWAREDRARVAVKHACAIWFIVSEEMGRPSGNRAVFNLFAFLALHHSSVIIWTYTELHTQHNLGSSCLALKLGHKARGRPDLLICRENKRELLTHFSSLCEQVCDHCALNRSFATSALAMAHCSFPV